MDDRILPGAMAGRVRAAQWCLFLGFCGLFALVCSLPALQIGRFPVVPLFMFLVPAGSAWASRWGAGVLRKAERAGGKICLSCGYDLNGQDGFAICPECGRPQHLALTAELWRRTQGARGWEWSAVEMPTDGRVQWDLHGACGAGTCSWKRDTVKPGAIRWCEFWSAVFASGGAVAALLAGAILWGSKSGATASFSSGAWVTMSVGAAGLVLSAAACWRESRRRRRRAESLRGFACAGCCAEIESVGAEFRCKECDRVESVAVTRELWRLYLGKDSWAPEDEAAIAGRALVGGGNGPTKGV